MIDRLPPRERQVAQVVYARGEASANEVIAALPDLLSSAAVRSMLSRLVTKGVVRRRRDGKRFLYVPSVASPAARDAALRRISRDYFGGSLTDAADAMIRLRDRE